MVWPASAADTYGLSGTVTVVPVASTAGFTVVVDVPPPVDPKYLRNRKKKLRLP